MRKPIALIAAASVAACGIYATATGAASTVNVGDNYFVRQSGVPTVNAAKDARITFKYVGRKSHTVSVKSGPLKFTAPKKSSGSYKTPKLEVGTYTIICTIHGQSDQSMKLKVE